MAIAAMIKMIATTIRSSISENPFCFLPMTSSPGFPTPAKRGRGRKPRDPIPPPESTKFLADGRVGHGGARTGRVGADNARLIGEEGPLPGCPNGYWNCRDAVRGPAAGGKGERIAALGAAGQDRVNQVRRGGRGRGRRTQARQGGRVAAVGGRIGDASRVQRSQREIGRAHV